MKKNNRIYEKFTLILTLFCLSKGIVICSPIIANLYRSYKIEKSTSFTEEELKNMLFNSKKLSDEEREMLYNKDFFTDILNVINTSPYMLYEYGKKFKNIDILPLDDKILGDYYSKEFIAGFYNYKNANKIYTKYEDTDKSYKHIIEHEFVHLCEYQPNPYNLIVEPATEIIIAEYYNQNCKSIIAYSELVEFLKVLMEIIGPEPIWNYIFLGDFSYIDNAITPYLTDEEYTSFKNSLICDVTDYHNLNKNLDILNKLLDKIYYNKFNSDINEDEIIDNIRNNESNICRYYFNYRLINQENSYYITEAEKKYTLEESNKLGYLTLYYNNKEISYDEYLSLKDNKDICLTIIASFQKMEDGYFYYLLEEKIYVPTIFERNTKIKTLY